MPESPSSKDRGKRPLIKPRGLDPTGTGKIPGKGFRAVDDIPREEIERPAARLRPPDPDRKMEELGARFRALEKLRQEQIDTNTRWERRSKRSTIVEEPQWDGNGPMNTHPVRKRSPGARSRERLLAFGAFAFIGAGFLAAFAAVVWSAFVRPAMLPTEGKDEAKDEATSAAPVDEAANFESIVTDVIAMATHYFAADSIEKRAEYVHEADRVLPLMNEHYRGRALEDDRPLRIGIKEAYLIEVFNAPKRFLVTSLEMRDRKTREIVFVASADGAWKIDWESLVGYSETSWKTFADHRSATPLRFRVVVRKDDYYNYEFNDEERYSCFRLNDYDESLTLYGYVERGSIEEFDMQQAVSDKGYALLVLDLRFREESLTGSQVEIVEVVASSWLPGVRKQLHAITERMPLPN